MAAPSCDPDIARGSCMQVCGNEGDEGELEGEGTPAISGKTTKENNDVVARTASKVQQNRRIRRHLARACCWHIANRWCRQPEQQGCQLHQGSLDQLTCAARPQNIVESLVTSRGVQLCLPSTPWRPAQSRPHGREGVKELERNDRCRPLLC